MSKYQQNEDVINLAKVLALGIVVFLFLAIVLSGLAPIVATGATVTFMLWDFVAIAAYYLAALTATYGILLILGKDDSNIMRVIAAFYFLFLLAFLAMKLGI